MGGVVIFLKKATTPLTKKTCIFAFRKCSVYFKRVVLKKKKANTHPRTLKLARNNTCLNYIITSMKPRHGGFRVERKHRFVSY